MASVTVYHNPKCGTSRNVVAMLQERGIQPVVVEYLKKPPSRQVMEGWLLRSGLGAREFIRTREGLYTALDLGNPKWTEGELLDFLAAHPQLLNRPVVETAKGVRPCRPAQTVLELLD
jgi:arsenate reductase